MPTFRKDLHMGNKVALYGTDDLRDQAITTEKLADKAVTLPKLAEEVMERVTEIAKEEAEKVGCKCQPTDFDAATALHNAVATSCDKWRVSSSWNQSQHPQGLSVLQFNNDATDTHPAVRFTDGDTLRVPAGTVITDVITEANIITIAPWVGELEIDEQNKVINIHHKACKLVFQPVSNLGEEDAESLAGASCTVETAEGELITLGYGESVLMPFGCEVRVAYGDVAGYTSPAEESLLCDEAEKVISGEYKTRVVTFDITSNQNIDALAGSSIIVNGKNYTVGTLRTERLKLPFADGLPSISFADPVEYRTTVEVEVPDGEASGAVVDGAHVVYHVSYNATKVTVSLAAKSYRGADISVPQGAKVRLAWTGEFGYGPVSKEITINAGEAVLIPTDVEYEVTPEAVSGYTASIDGDSRRTAVVEEPAVTITATWTKQKTAVTGLAITHNGSINAVSFKMGETTVREFRIASTTPPEAITDIEAGDVIWHSTDESVLTLRATDDADGARGLTVVASLVAAGSAQVYCTAGNAESNRISVQVLAAYNPPGIDDIDKDTEADPVVGHVEIGDEVDNIPGDANNERTILSVTSDHPELISVWKKDDLHWGYRVIGNPDTDTDVHITVKYSEGADAVYTLTVVHVAVTELSIIGADSVKIDETIQLSVTGQPAKLFNSSTAKPNIRWKVNDLNGYATIDQNGALTGIATGNTNIKAEVMVGGSAEIEANKWVSVQAKVVPIDFINLPDLVVGSNGEYNIEVIIGTPKTVEATINEGATSQLNWSVDNSTKFRITPSSDKLSCEILAIEGQAEDNDRAVVTVTGDSVTKIINVKAVAPTILPQSVSISLPEGFDKATYNVPFNVSCSVLPSDAAYDTVWESSDDNVLVVLKKQTDKNQATVQLVDENPSVKPKVKVTLSGTEISDEVEIDFYPTVHITDLDFKKADGSAIPTYDGTEYPGVVGNKYLTIANEAFDEYPNSVDVRLDITPSSGYTDTFRVYSSGNNGGVTITELGNSLYRITGTREGEVYVTASASNGVSDNVFIIIKQKPSANPIESVALSSDGLVVTEGDNAVTISAILTPADTSVEATETPIAEWAFNTSTSGSVDVTPSATITRQSDGTYKSECTLSNFVHGAGTVTVTCNHNLKASCPITINPVLVTGVSLNNSTLALNVGDSESLIPTVTPNNATDKSLTWTSSNTNVATVENGLVTAVGEGTCVITATSNSNPNAKATCNVTVSDPYTPKSVRIDYPIGANELTVGQDTGTFTAVVTPSTAQYVAKWSTPSNDGVVSIEDNGDTCVVTPLKEGTATLKVNVGAGIDSQLVTITVEEEEEEPTVSVDNIIMNPTSVDIAVGKNKTIEAQVVPYNANNTVVTWSSSDTSVATVGATTHDENGKNTCVINGVSSGTAVITASCGGKTATCNIKVAASGSGTKSVVLDALVNGVTAIDTTPFADQIYWYTYDENVDPETVDPEDLEVYADGGYTDPITVEPGQALCIDAGGTSEYAGPDIMYMKYDEIPGTVLSVPLNYRTQITTVSITKSADADQSVAVPNYISMNGASVANGSTVKLRYGYPFGYTAQDVKGLTKPSGGSYADSYEKTLVVEYTKEAEWVDLGLPSGRRWATKDIGAAHIGDMGSTYSDSEVSAYTPSSGRLPTADEINELIANTTPTAYSSYGPGHDTALVLKSKVNNNALVLPIEFDSEHPDSMTWATGIGMWSSTINGARMGSVYAGAGLYAPNNNTGDANMGIRLIK